MGALGQILEIIKDRTAHLGFAPAEIAVKTGQIRARLAGVEIGRWNWQALVHIICCQSRIRFG